MAKKPTTKQQKAIDILVGSGGKITPTEAMRQAEYAVATYNTPQKLTESKAYLENFNVPKAKETVAEIMTDKSNDANARLKATDQVFKVEGAYAPDKTQSVVVQVNIEQRAEIEKLANETAEKLYAKETNENNG